MSKIYTPRLSIDLPPKTKDRLQQLIPWGSTSPMMISLLEQALDFIESVGKDNAIIVIGAIISKKISVIDIMRKFEEVKKNDKDSGQNG